MTDEFRTFTWRGYDFKVGLGGCYHPAHHIPGTEEVSVWFEDAPGFNCWLASIIPNDACKARRSLTASRGVTACAALDSEVVSWLAAMLALPGASDLLPDATSCAMRIASLRFIADREAAGESQKSPESSTDPDTRT